MQCLRLLRTGTFRSFNPAALSHLSPNSSEFRSYHSGSHALSPSAGRPDAYEEFKRSFMAPTTAQSSSSHSARNRTTNTSSLSIDTISPEVLSVMLEETLQKGDTETLRLLLVEARTIGKLRPELLRTTFDACFSLTVPTKANVTFPSVSPEMMNRHMSNASFILQLSLQSPELAFLVKEEYCQTLLAWLVDQGKWFQSAIVAEYMVERDYEFIGENEVFFVSAGLMKNSLGVARAVKLLTTVVNHRRSDLSEMFSYSKMNRYSLSMGGSHSYKQDLDAACLRQLSDALLQQIEENNWFSFGASKTLVALACGSQHHDIAIRFVRKAVDLAEHFNSSLYGDNPVERGAMAVHSHARNAKIAQGRATSMASVLGKALSVPTTDDVQLSAPTFSSSQGPVDILSFLRACSQGAGVASTDANSFRGHNLDSPLSQVLIDISARLMSQQTRMNMRHLGKMPQDNVSGFPGRAFLSGPVKNVAFLKMYWVLCHRVNRQGGVETRTGGRVEPKEDRGGLKAEAMSDSYPRHRYAPSDDSLSNKEALTDTYLRNSYNQLAEFMADKESQSMTCSPAPGYHRRVFRYLCDELRLRHNVVELLHEKAGGMGDTHGVRVWKDVRDGHHEVPPTLSELLNRDARRGHRLRRFDGHPNHWSQIEEYLNSLDSHTLSEMCVHTTGAMKVGYPSVEWGLLLGRCLRDVNLNYPTGFLKNIITMAANRSDIYGLLEVLYANQESYEGNRGGRKAKAKGGMGTVVVDRVTYTEDEALAAGLTSLKTIAQKEEEANQEERRLEQRFANEGSTVGVPVLDAVLFAAQKANMSQKAEQERQAQASAAAVDANGLLNSKDWNAICGAAYHCRLSDIPQSSFRDSYTEVMRLMRTAGVELEAGTMRTLLRFLVYTDPSADLTWRILRRMSRDKTMVMTHIECTALTYLVLRRLRDMPGVQIARPMYKTDNYLFIYPSALSHIVDCVVSSGELLGKRFLRDFETAWANAHSKDGRNDLYTLLEELIAPGSPLRQRLIEEASPAARHCVLKLSLYIAYLVGAHGSEDLTTSTDTSGTDHAFRRAFDLLYAAECLQQDAEVFQRQEVSANQEEQPSDESYADDYDQENGQDKSDIPNGKHY